MRMRNRQRMADQHGFTLIELMVVLALMSVVTAAALSLVESGFRTERATQARADALEDLRNGLDRIATEARQALSVEASSTRSRLDMRTLVAGQDQQVVYDVSGELVRRSVDGGPPMPLLSGLTSSTIFCYDPPDCVSTGPDSPTTLIRISLAVAPSHFAHGATLSLTTDVHLRNSST